MRVLGNSKLTILISRAARISGRVAVIAHDRRFPGRIATHMQAREDGSKRTFFAGNYPDYEADKAGGREQVSRAVAVKWQHVMKLIAGEYLRIRTWC